MEPYHRQRIQLLLYICSSNELCREVPASQASALNGHTFLRYLYDELLVFALQLLTGGTDAHFVAQFACRIPSVIS